MEVREHFDKKAGCYFEHVYLSGKKNCHVHNQQRRRQYFRNLLVDNGTPQAAPALDIGSGPGTIAQDLIDCGFTTFAIDISFNMLLNNRKNTRRAPKLAQCSADSLCYKDNSFDIVTGAGVLEYVPEQTKVLSEIRRVLKPGGTLILSVPIGEWVVSATLRKHLGRLLLKKKTNRFYHRSYTPSHFLKQVQAAGFDLKTTVSHHFVFFPFDYLFPKLSAKLDYLLMRFFEKSRFFARFGKTFIVSATNPLEKGFPIPLNGSDVESYQPDPQARRAVR